MQIELAMNLHKGRYALFALALATLTSRTMAGCGVNFDKMKKRRIEAIRGQILSKLGMTELPNDNESPPLMAVPREIEDMYNRTRDFVLEQARQKRLECEEPEESYYAQDIQTVYQRAAATDSPSNSRSMKRYKVAKTKKQLSEFFYFNLENSNLNPDTIVSASLRLYQVQLSGIPHGVRQQVELFQLSPPDVVDGLPEKRFVTTKIMDTFGQGWQNFDVTSSVREWSRLPMTNLGLELTLPCTEDDAARSTSSNSAGEAKSLKVTFAGSPAAATQSSTFRGDQDGEDVTVQHFPNEFYPHLVIMVRTPSAHSKTQTSSHRRRKRALDADYCFRRNPSETNCCLRELFIDFRRDLGWNWIHAPSGYKSNFCAGACPYLWSMDNQHATILSLYKTMNPRASSSPCCTPKELEPLTIMYYDKGRYRFTQMSDMVLLSCKCS